MTPTVSVIIPVYNTDKRLLDTCMDSVLKQTFKDMEVILVDDGSESITREHCDELAAADSRITVIHQNNQGVSAARNNGTAAAKGKYVFYVDGDDVLTPIAIEEGVRHITDDGVDIVIAGIQKIDEYSELKPVDSFSDHSEVLTKDRLDELKRHYISLDDPRFSSIKGYGYINRGPVCRLMKKEIALSNPFPGNIPIGEDLIWNLDLVDKCDSVCIVDNVWYGYYKSSTSSAIRKYYGDRIEKIENYLKIMTERHGDFCAANADKYGKNLAVEFYCILRYELLSEKCGLSRKEKNELVRRLLKKEPWSVLNTSGVKRALPFKNRMLLLLSRLNMWQFAMKSLYGRK